MVGLWRGEPGVGAAVRSAVELLYSEPGCNLACVLFVCVYMCPQGTGRDAVDVSTRVEILSLEEHFTARIDPTRGASYRVSSESVYMTLD